VNHFGGEDLTRILISDIDTKVKQVMRWEGSTPLYLLRSTSVDKQGSFQWYPTTNEEQALEMLTTEYNEEGNLAWENFGKSPFQKG
jgi:hypothetical protein